MAETKSTPEAPGKVDPEKVKARAALLVQHGTDPLLAEKIAEDAEQAQLAHDAALKTLQSNRATAAEEAPVAKKGGK